MIVLALVALPLFCAWRWYLRATTHLPLLPVWADRRLADNRKILAARWPAITLATLTAIAMAALADRQMDLDLFAPFGRIAVILLILASWTALLVTRIALADRKEIDAAAKIRLHEPAPPPMPEAPQILYQAADARHLDIVDTRRVRVRN